MSSKYLGAILVILGCGGFGFSMAAAHRREEKLLRQLQDILQYMYCELQFHLTPLPELCRGAAKQGSGVLSALFRQLAEDMDQHRSAQISDCMHRALSENEVLPSLRELLTSLGSTLGQFDLAGQLLGLESLRMRCSQMQETLSSGREDRLRSYQTLGLCAGAAIVILLV